MELPYEIDAIKEYATNIYGVKFSEKPQYNLLFIKNNKDIFKINTTDKERFGEYTVFHKNQKSGTGYHVQTKTRELGFAIYLTSSHELTKEVDIPFSKEDWFAFKRDALKYYFRRK